MIEDHPAGPQEVALVFDCAELGEWGGVAFRELGPAQVGDLYEGYTEAMEG